MNDDRIGELYRGELSSTETQRVHRDRIHWIVQQARGRVLDIGSSQGIVSILMARRGLEVVGVEIEEPAITYARKALSDEPAEVQGRLRFVHADIHAAMSSEKFDTIVLGEILEHLAAPRALWLRAAQLLAPGGQLVGTTPFGLHPHPDHRTTFYLRNFVDTIAGVGVLTHLAIEDGFIRFTVRTEPDAIAVNVDPAALLALSERAFLASQLVADAARLEARSKLAARAEQIAALKTQMTSVTQKHEAEVAGLAADVSTQRVELAAARRQLAELARITTPPEDASPRMRGFSAFLGSLLREVNTGGLRESPLQALRKTYARIRRAARGELSSGE